MPVTTPVVMAGFLVAAAAAAWSAPGAAETDEQREKACANPDMIERVVGREICLAIHTFGAEAAGPSPTLVVVLHGDMSSGGPPEYHLDIARRLAKAGVVAVGIIRPGYTDKDDRTSEGSTSKNDHYTARNVDAIADAIGKLKGHYKAAATALIGHSGGAAIAGVVIGRHPGVADRALLIACPCDIIRWRNMNRRSPWFSSLSPIDYAGKVPKSAKVIAVTGERDDNTDAELARDYVATLKKRGVAARFVAIPGAGHHVDKKMRDTADYARALNDIVTGDL